MLYGILIAITTAMLSFFSSDAAYAAITFPDIDPVAVSLGPVAIRWYALAYIAGIVLGWMMIGRLNKKQDPPILSEPAYENIIVWAVFGILIGGRLGYVFFYNFDYYSQNLADIPKVWRGGMAFHGGLIGVIVAMFMMAKRYQLRFWSVMDILACATPIGLFFGRIANFVNGELFGRVADPSLPWAIIFPSDPFARHPSQLYQALLEGLALFVIMMLLVRNGKRLQQPGFLSGVFLIGYGAARFVVEFYREPDAQLGLILGPFSMGQVLCVPMIAFGVYLIQRARKASA